MVVKSIFLCFTCLFYDFCFVSLVSLSGSAAHLPLQVSISIAELVAVGPADLQLLVCLLGSCCGFLSPLPAQDIGHVPQEHAHMLSVAQCDAQLAETIIKKHGLGDRNQNRNAS